MYEIRFLKRAVDDLMSIDPIWQKRIKRKIEILANNPASLKNNIKVLKGKYSGLARLRVGNHRVIFRVKESTLMILIIRIATRLGVY